MTNNDFCLLFCSSDGHIYYDEQQLTPEDQKRIQITPKLSFKKDWQSSRYLKQVVPINYQSLSLSHKKAHAALIATTRCHAPLGIDIEYCQDRDFMALAQLCCTTHEQIWLQQQPDVNTAFYQLWTLKESIIKAHHGQLADMKQWPLVSDVQAGIQLPPTPTPLQAYSALLTDHWLLSLVYPRSLPALRQVHCQGFGLWQMLQPHWQAWPSLDSA